MSTPKRHLRAILTLLFAWILGLATSACGGSSELAPAKSASGPASAGYAEEEAAVASEPAPTAPAGMPADAPAGFSDDKPIAQASLPRAMKGEATDVPSPTPGVSPAPATPPPSAQAPASGREPLLIYTATMTLAVYGAREAITAVEELARTSGGYLVSRGDENITIRVPTKAFQGALGGVSKLGDELHREVNVRDVTEQFADLEVRLKNAEAVRLRFEALLAKAGKVEDALAVERELERVAQTIEQLKGRLRLLGELVAFSTITVNFRARPHDQVGSEVRLPFGWLGELGLVPLMNLEAP